MPTVTVNVTTWREKRSTGAMRVVLLQGVHTSRKGGGVPVLILRLCGRKGCRPIGLPERLELNYEQLNRFRADLYNGMDVEWVVESEKIVSAKTEGELSKSIGRKTMGLIGPSLYEFLASWFPISIDKRVYRSLDGLSTVRIVNALNQNGTDLVFVATKRAGFPETFEAHAVGPGLSRTAMMNPVHTRAYTEITQRRFTVCEDEAGFREGFGRRLLAWISAADYARLVRNGDKSDVTLADYWDDGYDLGGNGPAPTLPAAPNTVATQSRAEPGTGRAADAPRLIPINAMATRPADKRAVDRDGYEDDPSFGSY